MTRWVKRPGLLLGASLLGLALSGTAGAQTATAPSAVPSDDEQSATTPNDIIVTANKREERVQDVALSITAVSGDELNRQQLLDLQDLASRVPGLSFQRGGNGPSQRVIIRGLNTGSAGAAGTVASVIDDVPLTFSASGTSGADFSADIDPFDLQRVEVLKGPQGTLYGASAEGGLIKYVTNAPDPSGLHAGFDVGGLNLRHGDSGASGKAFINVPLGQTVAFRASGFYEYSPGWINNQVGKDREINDFRRYGGRASLLFAPSSALTLRATALYQRLDQDGFDTVEVRGVASPGREFELTNGYNFNTYVPQPSRAETQVYSGDIKYDFGGVQLQSITSFGRLKTAFTFDNPIYVPLGALFYGFVNTTLASNSTSSLKKFNQELRLSSSNNAAASGHGLEWQVGGYYTRERAFYTNDYITRDASTGLPVVTAFSRTVLPPGSSQVFLATLLNRYREFAGYADATYHFSPAFDIEVGGRVFNNKQNFTQTTGGALFSPPAFATVGPFRASETNFTYAVAPRIHFGRDVIGYGRVASGYRPGGPNPVIPPPTAAGEPAAPAGSFKRDKTTNFEVGLKGNLARVFSFDVAAFRINWTDIQVALSIPRAQTGYTATVNGGKARSQGFEWTFNLRPVSGLSIGWLGAYTEAKLRQNIAAINGGSGQQLPYVPKWQTTVTADYEFALAGDMRGFIGGSFSRTGTRFTNFNARPTLTHLEVPGYETVGGQLGIRTDRFTVQLYGKNLGDTRGITSYYGGQTIAGIPNPASAGLIRPREIGVRLSSRF